MKNEKALQFQVVFQLSATVKRTDALSNLNIAETISSFSVAKDSSTLQSAFLTISLATVSHIVQVILT
jgi:hypothetical protein